MVIYAKNLFFSNISYHCAHTYTLYICEYFKYEQKEIVTEIIVIFGLNCARARETLMPTRIVSHQMNDEYREF